MTKLPVFLVLVLCALLAGAQSYPSRTVKVVVPYPAGSTPDIVARALSNKLQFAMGQTFVVENRSGAAGNIGADAVAKSAPDGYSLLVAVNGPVAVNKYLYRGMPYDPDRDLVPISLLASSPQMLAIHPGVSADSFREFVTHLRGNPGRLSYASVGAGSASHLTMELLKSDANVFIVHIPYRGFPPAVTDMLAGNIHAMFAIIPAVLPHVKAGKMKALAVTGLKRSALAPEVPSVAELGYSQLESLAWIGLLAPTGTPEAVLAKLEDESVRAMRAQDTRESLGKLGFDVVASSRGEFAAWIRSESSKWSKVIKASGATAD